jgi:LacI family transcriptional regulator, galactose operon repressor
MTRFTSSTSIRHVTVADVARYAGVSPAVVSYVVNDGPRKVAPTTANRVREAIAVLGYRPNSSARALRTGTTAMLGLVLPGASNTFFGEYADVIYDAADRAGFALLTASSGANASTEHELIEDLASRNVDGILVATMMTKADISAVRHPGLPIVLINCPFAVPGFRTLGPDAVDGSRRVVEHLLTVHDHRSVALITGEAGVPEPEARETGWRDALRSHGRPEGILMRTNFTRQGGYDAAKSLLARSDRPTAIFATSDLQAFGVLRAIRERKLDVPGDIALVSFDGIEESGFCWPPLTVTKQPVQAMANAAIAALQAGGEPGHELFEMELIIRQSCGCMTEEAFPTSDDG